MKVICLIILFLIITSCCISCTQSANGGLDDKEDLTGKLPSEATVIKEYSLSNQIDQWIIFQLDGKTFLFYHGFNRSALTQIE